MKESSIQKTILEYLKTRGIYCFRFNNQPTYSLKQKCFLKSTNDPGISDIIFFTPQQAVFGAIEVKTEKDYNYVTKHYWKLLERNYEPWGKTKEHLHHQCSFINKVNLSKGLAGFACSIRHVEDILQGRFLDMINGKKNTKFIA